MLQKLLTNNRTNRCHATRGSRIGGSAISQSESTKPVFGVLSIQIFSGFRSSGNVDVVDAASWIRVFHLSHVQLGETGGRSVASYGEGVDVGLHLAISHATKSVFNAETNGIIQIGQVIRSEIGGGLNFVVETFELTGGLSVILKASARRC